MDTNTILNHIYNTHEAAVGLNSDRLFYYINKYKRLSATTNMNKYSMKRIRNAICNLCISLIDENHDELSKKAEYIAWRLHEDEPQYVFYNNILSITIPDESVEMVKKEIIPITIFSLVEDKYNDETIYSLEIAVDEDITGKIMNLNGFNIDIINEFHNFNTPGDSEPKKIKKSKTWPSININVRLAYSINAIKHRDVNNMDDVSNILSYLYSNTMPCISSLSKENDDDGYKTMVVNKCLSMYILLYNKISDKFNNKEDTHKIYRMYLNHIAKTNEMIESSIENSPKYFGLLKLKNVLIRSADMLKEGE